jgi:hypothetical protein
VNSFNPGEITSPMEYESIEDLAIFWMWRGEKVRMDAKEEFVEIVTPIIDQVRVDLQEDPELYRDDFIHDSWKSAKSGFFLRFFMIHEMRSAFDRQSVLQQTGYDQCATPEAYSMALSRSFRAHDLSYSNFKEEPSSYSHITDPSPAYRLDRAPLLDFIMEELSLGCADVEDDVGTIVDAHLNDIVGEILDFSLLEIQLPPEPFMEQFLALDYKSAELAFQKDYFTRQVHRADGSFPLVATRAGVSTGRVYTVLEELDITHSR